MPYDVDAVLAQRGSAWFDVAQTRRSWRSYDESPIAAEDLEALKELAESFRPYDDARCVVVADAPADLFRGIVGSYGAPTGAPHALMMLARDTERCQQHAGYTGEALVLEAGARGVDTCWIGGNFDREKAAALHVLEDDEHVVCVSPLGTRVTPETMTDQLMHTFARSDTRKRIGEIAPGIDDRWPAWARVAVECARLAPSALNRQPWLFSMHDGELVLRVAKGRERPEIRRALDCGIAMLHAQLGALQTGEAAQWHEDVADGELARLRPSDAADSGEAQ